MNIKIENGDETLYIYNAEKIKIEDGIYVVFNMSDPIEVMINPRIIMGEYI